MSFLVLILLFCTSASFAAGYCDRNEPDGITIGRRDANTDGGGAEHRDTNEGLDPDFDVHNQANADSFTDIHASITALTNAKAASTTDASSSANTDTDVLCWCELQSVGLQRLCLVVSSLRRRRRFAGTSRVAIPSGMAEGMWWSARMRRLPRREASRRACSYHGGVWRALYAHEWESRIPFITGEHSDEEPIHH